MCKRIFANQTSEIGDIPFYKIGTIGNTPDSYISRELFEEYKHKYNYPRKGEVMITCAGTVGKAIVFNGEDSYYQDSNIVWIDNPIKEIDNTFIYYKINCVDWNKLNSTTITRIYNDDLRKLKISYPSIAEQIKITKLLQIIDDRIATQIKIIQQLQSLIKGIVVSVTAETPNTHIDKCLVCHSSTLQENQIEEFGDFPVYGANGICGYTDNADFNEPAILIVKDGSGVGNVRYVSGQYSAIGTQNVLTPQNGYSLKYIFYSLQAFNFVPYKTGMAIPHIYFKDYGKAKIYCPGFEQQVKIASQIDLVESKIEIETQLLNKYEEQKKFLLSNMFI